MRWLGLQWDEGPGVDGGFGPYFQTERLHLYREHAERLISEGKAYRCYCTREEIEARRRIAESEKRQYRYEGTCRDRSEEHTSELQSRENLVCRLLLEKKKIIQ